VICFPNAKINIGLYITGKRSDGFHDLETVFAPVKWCDALEVIAHDDNSSPFIFTASGRKIDGSVEDNILYKTWSRIRQSHRLPPLAVHLHKAIPMGAGLGGGSSDAAFFIRLLNEKFHLGMSAGQMHVLALEAGSDCPFFLLNKPSFASGRGERFGPVELHLNGMYVLLVYPGIHINTGEAFRSLRKIGPEPGWEKALAGDIKTWRHHIRNDFEAGLAASYPQIAKLKDDLYDNGALYASLSGSGSTVFGIYSAAPQTAWLPPSYDWFISSPD
jgi:4-diphosphocytidyl-2-C-methyl-D-erythritol kinase